MIVSDLVGDGEVHSAYQRLQVENLQRQYDFLRSLVTTSLSLNQPLLSTELIKALNFHAIACLHAGAGQFRPCAVQVGTDGEGQEAFHPVPHYRVPSLMDQFVNYVNRQWENADPVILAAYVMWRLNWIHPFINGNGRTARAICYYVLCVKSGVWLPGETILPELVRRNREEYVEALQQVDKSAISGKLDISPLHQYLQKLLGEQLATFSNVKNDESK